MYIYNIYIYIFIYLYYIYIFIIYSSVCVRINDFPRSMGEVPSPGVVPSGSPPSFAWCAWSPQTPRCMPPVLCRNETLLCILGGATDPAEKHMQVQE